MGQQQILLIILGLIIVAIAIAVGITQSSAHSTQANEDGITTSLVSIAADAFQYKIRPGTLGGGSGSYFGYQVPRQLVKDDNGMYAVSVAGNTSHISFSGTSEINTAWVATLTEDDSGKTTLTFNGW
jgi:hypothetical protein